MYFCRWVELACHLVCHVVSAHLLGVSAVRVLFKGALYRIWCGVNRLGDSGVNVV